MPTGMSRAARGWRALLLALALLAASVVGLGGAAAASKHAITPHVTWRIAPKTLRLPLRPMPPLQGVYAMRGCRGTSFRDSLSAPATTVWACFIGPNGR